MSTSKTLLSGLVALLAATLVVGAPRVSAAATPLRVDNSSVGNIALTWAPAYMSSDHSYTSAEAEALARSYDLIGAMPVDFQQHVNAMRDAAPGVKLLAYSNGAILGRPKAAGVPEASFTHDATGDRITLPGFDSYLMDASDAAWQRQAYNMCVDRMTLASYDGCLVDNLTLGVFTPGYVSALPINSKTGAAYTEAEYQQSLLSLVGYFRRQNPSFMWVGNSVENAYRYLRSTVTSSAIVAQLPGAQMEDFLRGAKSAVAAFPQGQDWLDNVDVIRAIEATGKTGLFTTKLWVPSTNSQLAAWQKFAMATFLMGADGDSYLAFTTSRDKAGVMGSKNPYRMPSNLGASTGGMIQHSSGAYFRTFANGTAVVNPTPTKVDISFTSPVRTLAGNNITSLSLPANGADVLVGSGSPINIGTADTVKPTATIISAAAHSAPVTQTLTVVGTAVDNQSVSAVRVAIRDEQTMKWLQQNGSWGNYEELSATLDSPNAASTTWRQSFPLRTGTYGVSVTAIDGAANKSSIRPWTAATL